MPPPPPPPKWCYKIASEGGGSRLNSEGLKGVEKEGSTESMQLGMASWEAAGAVRGQEIERAAESKQFGLAHSKLAGQIKYIRKRS
jgi:hypothetical protein